jgi:peptide methionine sulfoxide reductase msrA/msrB
MISASKQKGVVFFIFLTSLFVQACGQPTKIANIKSTVFMEKIEKTEQEWKSILSPEQYYILRQKGTERPYTGALLATKEKGIYKCAGCGNELFSDNMKFDSHCGWTSFDREIAGGKINKVLDTSHGMMRTEIVCARCDGHLGHLFDDGPTQTQQRYCVNSLSLTFEPSEQKPEKIVLGGGCFWCTEAIFINLKGIEKVTSGYAGGITENPTYKEVISGKTQHAEVVEVVFNPKLISLEKILEIFFTAHDPTTLNQQGADRGTQYRSAIYYINPQHKSIIDKIITILEHNKVFKNPIVTEVKPLKKFYKAEGYHQNYYNQNKKQPYCQLVIEPKLNKIEQIFKEELKTTNE